MRVFFGTFQFTKNASDRIAVPGMKRQLLLVQGFAVYWMLATENSDTGGSFLADETGLGKVILLRGIFIMYVRITYYLQTTILLFLIAMSRWIGIAHSEVTAA